MGSLARERRLLVKGSIFQLPIFIVLPPEESA
jgi:hypothetical protein